MRDSYRVVSASPEHVSVLPGIERAAAVLFGDAVPAELLEHVTPVPVLLGSQQAGTLWVALGRNDEPVGFARAVVDGPRVHLAELDVLPAHGRRGVGSSLVRAVVDWACAIQAQEITLTTYRDLPWNAPFYARLGFTIVPERDWGADLRHRFEEEAGLESERARRVVMRRQLDTASQAPQPDLEGDSLEAMHMERIDPRDYPGLGVGGLLIAIQFVLLVVRGTGSVSWLTIAGGVLLLASLVILVVPVIQLKRHGGVADGDIFANTTTVVDTGLYAVVRHPQFLAMLVLAVGTALIAQRWGEALVGAAAAGAFLVDFRRADRRDLAKFGQPYQEYMQRVPGWNPLTSVARLLRRHRR